VRAPADEEVSFKAKALANAPLNLETGMNSRKRTQRAQNQSLGDGYSTHYPSESVGMKFCSLLLLFAVFAFFCGDSHLRFQDQ
jgi:hypothetical protein